MTQTSHFWINKEFLQDVLRTAETDPQLEVEDWNVYLATKAGDNYAAIVLRANIKTRAKHGPKDYKLIMKCMPESELRQKMMRESGAFDKEIDMYDKVFLEFADLQKRKNVATSLLSYIPRCYLCQHTEGKEVIILEDLSQFGFKMADRRKGVDILHCELVMKELGKFHSLSYTLKKDNPEAFEKNVKCMKDLLYADEFRDTTGQFTVTGMDSLLSMVKRMPDQQRFIKKIEELKASVLDIMHELCEPKEPIAVLNHGDCWINNLMFRYEEKGGVQVPKEVKFLDFQISRYASPVLDILYFLFLGTSKDLRDKHLDDLLRVYYQSFSESLKMLGADPGKFTYEALKQEMREKYMFGIITAFTILPFIAAEPDKVPDLDSMKDGEFFNAKDNPIYSAYEENQVVMTRLKDVLAEMEEKGYLK